MHVLMAWGFDPLSYSMHETLPDLARIPAFEKLWSCSHLATPSSVLVHSWAVTTTLASPTPSPLSLVPVNWRNILNQLMFLTNLFTWTTVEGKVTHSGTWPEDHSFLLQPCFPSCHFFSCPHLASQFTHRHNFRNSGIEDNVFFWTSSADLDQVQYSGPYRKHCFCSFWPSKIVVEPETTFTKELNQFRK